VWTIPFGIIAFAALNAAFEEIIWRGVVMDALEAAVGRGWCAWLLQGIGFGVWHYAGFPSGWVGVGLATIFALMMGMLRMRGRGMLAPWIAHVFADVTIFILVAAMVISQ
jgi:membrane protease YdiL (CAAX protease family)